MLTAKECLELQARAEGIGFEEMGDRYPEAYRNNRRVVIDDNELAHKLFHRLGEVLEKERERDGLRWRLVGLNERFRFCHYRRGQRFSLHRDGAHSPRPAVRSLTTVMIYLNEAPAFGGGRTRFYSAGDLHVPVRTLTPRTGAAAIFDHDRWHDGEEVTHGDKYIMRTDVMYERVDATPVNATHRGYVWCLAQGVDGEVVSGSRDGSIRSWHVTDAGTLKPLGGRRGHDGSVTALATHDGALWSASRSGELVVWRDDQPVRVRDGGSAVLSLASDGREVLCTTSAGTMERWTTAGMLEERRLHRGWVWAAAPVSDGVVTCGEDGSIRRSARGGGWRAFVRDKGRPVSLRALAVGEGRLVAGDRLGRIQQWTSRGQGHVVVGRVPAPVTSLLCVGDWVVSGDEAGTVFALAPASLGGGRVLLKRHRDQVRSLLVAGDVLLSASYDGTLGATPHLSSRLDNASLRLATPCHETVEAATA